MSGDNYSEFVTDKDIECIIPKITDFLRNATSLKYSISEEVIGMHLSLKGLYVQPERIRILVAYIRINGLLPSLVKCEAGYYIAADNGIVAEQVKSLKFLSGLLHAEATALEQQISTTH